MAKLLYLKLILFCSIFGFLEACGEENPSSEGSYCTGTGWIAFNDEKCFKLINKWATRDDAQALCRNDFNPNVDPYRPTLATIKSEAEQTFLAKQIFEKSQVDVNVWIGAKRTSANQFQWEDGEVLEFTNWAPDFPTEESKRGCVEMKSEFMRKLTNGSRFGLKSKSGQWRDVTCNAHNLVVCEKLPKWSLVKIHETILAERKQNGKTRENLENAKNQLELTKNLLSSTRNELSQTQNQLTGTQNQLDMTRKDLSTTTNQLEEVKKNPIPLNFIYVQLSNQPEPKTLWPMVHWADVTKEYAGLFFRVEGSGSSVFGSIQESDSPRLTQIMFESHPNGNNGHEEAWGSTSIVLGGWSTGVGVFSGSYIRSNDFTHRFFTSGGEVRPKNMAMRIWKRI